MDRDGLLITKIGLKSVHRIQGQVRFLWDHESTRSHRCDRMPGVSLYPTARGLWGSSRLDRADLLGLRATSALGQCLVLLPFLSYHLCEGPRLGVHYRFPASLSHTIRRPGPTRSVYGLLYFCFLLRTARFAADRRARGATVISALQICGSLHYFFSLPSDCSPTSNPADRLHALGAASSLLSISYAMSFPDGVQPPLRYAFAGKTVVLQDGKAKCS